MNAAPRSHSPQADSPRPMRIVSLLPSATETVCQLGLGEQLVGVTHECDWPPFVSNLPHLTRSLLPTSASSGEIDALVRETLKSQQALYTLDVPVLERLRPDLIVTQGLCDVCAVAYEEVDAAVCRLPSTPRVVNLEPMSLGDVLLSVREVAEAAGIPERGQEVVADLQKRIDLVQERTLSLPDRPRVVFLEWLDPLFCAGHWNPELVRLAGGLECLGREGEPSRRVTWGEVVDAQPEVLFIACCGFTIERAREDLPLLQAMPGWSDLPCVRSGRVYMADGSAYFNRPGPRLVDSLEILADALHSQERGTGSGSAIAVLLPPEGGEGAQRADEGASVWRP